MEECRKRLATKKAAGKTAMTAEEARVLKAREDQFKKFRTNYLLFWLAVNVLFVSIILTGYFGPADCFLTWLALIVAFYNGLRLVGSVLHILERGCRGYGCRCCARRRFVKKPAPKKGLANPLLNDNSVAGS